MEFMEMQHAIVVGLIGFFRSWAIVRFDDRTIFEFLANFWNF